LQAPLPSSPHIFRKEESPPTIDLAKNLLKTISASRPTASLARELICSSSVFDPPSTLPSLCDDLGHCVPNHHSLIKTKLSCLLPTTDRALWMPLSVQVQSQLLNTPSSSLLVTLGLSHNRSVGRIKGNQATFDNSQRNNLRSCMWVRGILGRSCCRCCSG